MSTLLLRNGRVIDPSQNFDAVADLWLADGKVLGTGPQARTADRTIDCTGMIVSPGLIDMHVHLREPGREEDETIATGTAAAVAGGVTSVACMPNTEPPIDTRMAAEFVIQQAQRAGNCNVFPIGAVTKNRDGKELAELGGLVEGGAVAFTDDGAPVYSAEIMRRALEYCKMLNDRAVLVHAEILELTVGGVMNEGLVSVQLGLRGMPAVAEDIMIARDIMLSELTGGRVHILHVSTAGGVDLIRQGIAKGIRVSGEACPHHFLLTDETLRAFDSNYKMSPPLRTQRDVDAILAGLKDGTLSVLATDHAPHAPEKKERELDQAPNGILGLETFLPLCISHLIEPGHLSWPQMLEKMTINPAKVLGIDRGTLQTGRPADVTVIDPKARWAIKKAESKSKSRNTPFDGWKVTGRAVATIVGGDVKMNLLG
ncbi:dihydroorotase : Dihydroorotase OS=Singulisphaera acidiphila (strain ATCC BAA-1392 / DSM 18658 / VKM B-2454 / MOB10) GN=pyrC PE=3 SV=1: Amidohydro_4 [Gemmataceae bacterium]|nr:dihydroorotase : Dihydroorotase OS=Singulisphaera acidiphila (strain ATCC BAA-1392 / DSM 18658 / VKM B-2454 / MOB10) GN=pyrC PE=3 SV=1: Amidohydro_4 [Gemmataceae bacterium]VTT99313.1 dihydroorotase : Dihydroorotase OS=Singulisphaera acidiphila (strain ATCC BAA-1392 / DSM 18658 / VKM B-2454 / MOB10) GN=pyrC PE=3 SV=1: Amidohydro_4 [Gemmataceae bacterium]